MVNFVVDSNIDSTKRNVRRYRKALRNAKCIKNSIRNISQFVYTREVSPPGHSPMLTTSMRKQNLYYMNHSEKIIVSAIM